MTIDYCSHGGCRCRASTWSIRRVLLFCSLALDGVIRIDHRLTANLRGSFPQAVNILLEFLGLFKRVLTIELRSGGHRVPQRGSLYL